MTKRLPNKTHDPDNPIRIDEARISNKEQRIMGFSYGLSSQDIFDMIKDIASWEPIHVAHTNSFSNNPYYDHPEIMNKYRERKFKNPPKCPRCLGNQTINYMGDYVSHNTMFHGAPFSIVIKELEQILKK